MKTSNIPRPSLLGNPENLIPKMDDFVGERMDLPPYRPRFLKQLQNGVSAVVVCSFVGGMWAVFDSVRAFPYWICVTLVCDFLFVVQRLARFESLGFPKIPILYLPCTTVWAFGVAFPSLVYAYTNSLIWSVSLAVTLEMCVFLLGCRLVKSAIDQQLSDERVRDEVAVGFRKAQHNPKKFLPALRELFASLDDTSRFARLNDVLFATMMRNRFYLLLFLVPLVGVVCGWWQPPETVSTSLVLHWYWPGVAACVAAVFIVKFLTPAGRERLAATAWALQVFANTVPHDEDKIASWTAVCRYGHREDRRAYLVFSFALVAALLFQLLVSGPLFLTSATGQSDYPLVGTNLVSLTSDPGHWLQWSSATDQIALISLCQLPLPPVCLFFLLVSLCGERVRIGHKLFCASNAPTHAVYEFDFGPKVQQVNGKVMKVKK